MVVRDIPSTCKELDDMVEVYLPLRLPKRLFGLLNDAMKHPKWYDGAGFVAGLNVEVLELAESWFRDRLFEDVIGPGDTMDLFAKHRITSAYINAFARDGGHKLMRQIAGIRA